MEVSRRSTASYSSSLPRSMTTVLDTTINLSIPWLLQSYRKLPKARKIVGSGGWATDFHRMPCPRAGLLEWARFLPTAYSQCLMSLLQNLFFISVGCRPGKVTIGAGDFEKGGHGLRRGSSIGWEVLELFRLRKHQSLRPEKSS